MQGQVTWNYTMPLPPGGNMPPSITGVMYVPGTTDVLFTVWEPAQMRGAYEVSRAGQIVWQWVNSTVGHDAVRLPNGDTLIDTCHAEEQSPWPYTHPQSVEVNRQGQVVWAWYGKSLFQNDPKYNTLIGGTGFTTCPWTHTNEELRLPNGNTMISPTHFNMMIIIDKNGNLQQTISSCGGQGCPSGSLSYPHSENPLPNGDWLINQPVIGNAVELNPTTGKTVWTWPQLSGGPSPYFIRGSQRLPNGNTLIDDSDGQLFEVTQSGRVVWQMQCACYSAAARNAAGSGAPFFQAQRLSFMPPGFTVVSPVQHQSYTSDKVPLNVAPGFDLGNMTYSLRNNQNGTWIVRNATLVRNVYKDSLDPPTTTNGPASLSLANGNYTVRIFASSTGYGYKAFVQQTRINYASQDMTFVVNAAPTTTTSTTTTSSRVTATTSTASSTTPTTSTSTASSTFTTSTSTSSTLAASTSTSSASTTSSTSATNTSTSVGGIPEFPYQLVALSVFTVLIVASYLLVRFRVPH